MEKLASKMFGLLGSLHVALYIPINYCSKIRTVEVKHQSRVQQYVVEQHT